MVCCKDYEIVAKMKDVATAQKKVTKVDEIEKCIKVILGVIDYVNAQDEYFCSIWENHPLDEINVPNEFKDFVMPSAVRFDALNRRTKDLLVKPNKKEMVLSDSYADYVEACDRFRGFFKRDGFSDMVSLGSLRKAVNLNDVITRASINERVCAQGRPFIPVPLNDIGLFEDRYFNEDVKDVISDYITEMRFV